MRIALGVTGGIAAYKAAELLRLLQDRGLDVEVIMTRAAQEFVTPLTFAALSGHPVNSEVFEDAASPGESSIEHIALARRIKALVIAPATADVLAKLAHGMADDLLTTVALATRAPLIVAPSMNVNMWEHRATQDNIATLRQRGVQVVEPDAGYLACGMKGAGRLADLPMIAQAAFEALGLRDDLRDEILLVTAGPTHEPLDPVRYIANRSSGKMGFALAEAGRRRGARVLLISGPTHVEPPSGVELVRVETAKEMAEAVGARLTEATIVIMAAAVADFQPVSLLPHKIKKGTRDFTLALQPAPDILAEICRRRKPGQIVVGFAAETDHLLKNAGEKLRAKGADFIVANDVTQEGAGFASDTNIATLVFPGGRQDSLPRMSKLDLAHHVLDAVIQQRTSEMKKPEG
jgi:phosphopantothenoylcysteine decarboxylase / phosphopantothenate---cysteine ligase